MSSETEDDILPYSSISLAVGEKDAALTVMCCGVRLHIQVDSEALLGAQDGIAADIRLQFEDFLTSVDDEPEAMQAFEDWLLRPCIPHVQHLINLESWKETRSLQSYFHPTTLVFSLDNIPISEPAGEYNDIPKLVQQTGTERPLFYFKPAFEKDSFTRELDVLLRIIDMTLDVHVTRLAALIQWDDDESIGGLLVEYIPEPKTLDCVLDDSTHEERVRWMSELRSTVGRLHCANIIWGDVKPQNVLVDQKDQTWVIDFGGGHSLPWVDKDLGGTVEGDLQGLAAIAKFLGT